MIHRFASSALRTILHFAKPVCLTLALAVVAGEVAASMIDFTVGAREVIYTAKERKKRGLKIWPDGNMGVVKRADGYYEFYVANSSKPTRSIGTLTDPSPTKKWKSKVKIDGIPKKAFNYVAGGPIYRDPNSGRKLMLYHAEKHLKGNKDYYTVLGLAISTDPTGTRFTNLGTIIEPNVSIENKPHSIDVGGGSFVVFDDYLHVYFRDKLADGTSAQLAVARAPISEVVSNALAGIRTSFNKYYDGSWSEAGIGGKSSPLEIGNPYSAWSSVSYNDYLGGVVMVSAQPSATQTDLYMATSTDGINWSPRQAIVADPGEQFYPSIVGTGADASQSGQSFYVYYTDSQKGAWKRHKDAMLVRRQINLNSLIPPTGPNDIPPIDSEPEPELPTEWTLISDFRDDFQVGTPADGWTYAWNPSGRLGDQSTYAALLWSNAQEVYNTNGSLTVEPVKGKTHNEDYLHLRATGVGHPGQPGYMPIVGYTIQEGDGEGLYQIADSAISKIDSFTSKREDGLEVRVYVNDTLIGSKVNVSTNGALANFDRELGDLSVGDTVWVAINAGKNLYYDLFSNFDFSIKRAVPVEMMASLAGAGGISGSAVPEPSTLGLVLLGLLAYSTHRSRRS